MHTVFLLCMSDTLILFVVFLTLQIREQMTLAEKEEAVIEDPVFIESDEEEEEIEELEEEAEELLELTPEMEDEIDAALVPHPPNETLLDGFKLLITRHDIRTLNGLNWLNDEVINFYMQLIMARSQEDVSTRRNPTECHKILQ